MNRFVSFLTLPLLVIALASASFGAEEGDGELARRVAAAHAENPVEQWQLAQWCEENGHEEAMRVALERILARHPNHEPARKLLHQERVNGQWLSRGEARRERSRLRQRDRRVQSLMRTLAGSSDRRRDRARNDLLELARTENLPSLVPLTQDLHGQYQRWWNDYRLTLLEVRFQHSRLTSLEDRSVSLGTGRSVRIQFPRTRSVRLGTTTLVPSR